MISKIILFVVVLFATPAFSQRTKSGNDEVRVKSFCESIKVKFINCMGDKARQTVIIHFRLTNTSPSLNHSVRIPSSASNESLKTEATDGEGNQYSASLANLEVTKNFWNKPNLPVGGTIDGSITFTTISPRVTKLGDVSIIMVSQNINGSGNDIEGLTAFQNVVIDWK